MDFSLNHVVRKWSTPVDPRSNLLIQVPGGYNEATQRWEGPCGVLVCSEDYITYRHQGCASHRVPIPRRVNPLQSKERRRGNIIISSVCHRLKTSFFILVQNEDGDLFKITMEHEHDQLVSLRIKYFDTVPVASSLTILRLGFLFVASEAGPSQFYTFQKLGDDDDMPEYASTDYQDNGMTDPPPSVPEFLPRPLDNLFWTDELPALSPIVHGVASNALAQDSAQLFIASGAGPRSSFKMLRPGLEVEEAVSSELPGNPSHVWSTKLRRGDEFDSYIVLSFLNVTLVLSIGEQIEEVTDSGFLASERTLAVQQMGESALVQVHPRGIRHIQADKSMAEWNTPVIGGERTHIIAATTNERQVVIALSTTDIIYFELDQDGQMNEYQEHVPMGAHVLTLSIGPVPPGRLRTPYLAVGCADQTVRLFSLDPESTLERMSMQALTAPPSSIVIAEMHDSAVNRVEGTLFVNIGLQNGVLLRTVLDVLSGQLTDTRTRFLGAKPVTLVRVSVHGQPAVLALSSRPWISYTHRGRAQFAPLLFDALDYVWSFNAELCPGGLIGVAGGTLRILTIPQLDSQLKADSIPLANTPRRLAQHPTQPVFYLSCADHRVFSSWARHQRLEARTALFGPLNEGEQEALDLAADRFGAIRAEAGQWSSRVAVVDPSVNALAQEVVLEHNEAALVITTVQFTSAPDPEAVYVVVGSAVDMHVIPRAARACFLTTYLVSPDGRHLTLMHRTEVDEIPSAMKPFQGRLLVGMGKVLRIYDLGKKKLLRKTENRHLPWTIVALDSYGSRIVVGDQQESIVWAAYKAVDNRLVLFAEDTLPRWMSAIAMVDYDTVAGADKFGNIWLARLPAAVSNTVDEDPTGLTIVHEKSYLQGAPYRSEIVAHYYIGDAVTSLTLAPIAPAGRPVLLYTCLGGTIGALVPLASREDADLLGTLEMHLRAEGGVLFPLARDHMSFRSMYAPVKAVVDGDLCEGFSLLPPDRQTAIAEELDRTPGEINKKLDQIRAQSAF